MPTVHTLAPDRATLHGHFARDLAPVLTIEPGDTVRFRTLDSNWGLESYVPGRGLERREFQRRPGAADDGHALVGPVAVPGARPPMTLVVEIGAVAPGPYGACLTGGWPSEMNQRLGIADEGTIHVYTLDAARQGAISMGIP